MFFKQSHAKTSAFEGGITFPDDKNMSLDLPILDFMDPKEPLVFSMCQHPGEICQPLVKVGDQVLRDQPIGRPPQGGAFIYSSVSGKVIDIRPVRQPDGPDVDGIVIENDHEYTTVPAPFEAGSYKELSRGEILGRIHYAGIEGQEEGGPVHQKLENIDADKVTYILVNGIDPDPSDTSVYRMMIEDSFRVVNGLKILLHIFPEAKGRICIRKSQSKAADMIAEHIADDPSISICLMSDKYSQADEKLLILGTLKTEIPEGESPLGFGAIVISCDSAIAISRAVTQARPLERKIITISGDCIKTPRNFRVRIGTSLRELVEQCGPMSKRPRRILYGGLMQGICLDDLEMPVTKSTPCLTFLSTKDNLAKPVRPCIRCSACTGVCPMRLQPYRLKAAADKDDARTFLRFHGDECIGCGCCSYICPSALELSYTIRSYRPKTEQEEHKEEEEEKS